MQKIINNFENTKVSISLASCMGDPVARLQYTNDRKIWVVTTPLLRG
ncbi:hypothetical protein [Hydrocoleum sp. CS-953]|nr:hypothetical protein [Hydrocoleum sp. CS-953]